MSPGSAVLEFAMALLFDPPDMTRAFHQVGVQTDASSERVRVGKWRLNSGQQRDRSGHGVSIELGFHTSSLPLATSTSSVSV